MDSDGNTTIEYKEINLELKATPHVTPDNRVSLKIEIAKLDTGSIISGVQTFTNAEASTELLVNDGDTVVIGGIMKTTTNKGQSGIPGLRSIPLLGWLFKYDEESEDKKELLIFISTKIVKLEQKDLSS